MNIYKEEDEDIMNYKSNGWLKIEMKKEYKNTMFKVRNKIMALFVIQNRTSL